MTLAMTKNEPVNAAQREAAAVLKAALQMRRWFDRFRAARESNRDGCARYSAQ